MSTIAVAMSGGVDSSVAAYLLSEAGHEVIGFSMRLHPAHGGPARPEGSSGCCSPEDFQDARLVAARLGIRYYVLNFEDAFQRTVIDPFIAAYRAGETPSPCVSCNTHVKFRHFLARARAAGADYVATGHYARRTGDGPYELRRGLDGGKDQSYFLYGITQEELAHSLFPIGDLAKAEVRAIADRAGLGNAHKPDSQEICFVENGRYAAFVEASPLGGASPGAIRDLTGTEIGSHDGIHQFTVGQRRGLGINSRLPLYVQRLDAATNSVVVAPAADLLESRFTVRGVSWVGAAPAVTTTAIEVQIRSRHRAAPATLRVVAGDRASIELAAPERAVAPGQAAVFYLGDRVLGGGFIDRVGS